MATASPPRVGVTFWPARIVCNLGNSLVGDVVDGNVNQFGPVTFVGDAIRAIQEAGTSVLLIEQNATMALAVADRGYVLEHGRIIHEDTAANLRSDEGLQRLLLGLGSEEVA